MAADQQFCLRWNNHQSTLISVFDTLLENGTLVDCTLAAEGQYLKAHKVVLSACSPYLETLLSQHYEKHPIVILKDVKFSELKSMMDYMYRGEVNISQDQLGTFLKAAESLQIKGLSDNGDDARDVGSTTTTKRTDASSRPSVTPVRNNVESKRPAPPGDFSDASRDGSLSPSSLRKRRRTRRPSQGDDPDLDANNTCDLPTQAQSTPLPVPSSTVVPTPVPKQIVKQEPTSITRLDNSLNSPIAQESGLLKEKIEPPSEPLLEPKTEYVDYMNNENSIEVEDLTLDDDEEELDSSMDASRPGPSHGDISNQGYPHWNISGDQSGTDEIFMAAQEAVGAAAQQRDSQEGGGAIMENGFGEGSRSPSNVSLSRPSSPESFAGFSCGENKKTAYCTNKSHEKKKREIPEKKKKERTACMESSVAAPIRVGKPRSSKSRASLVWKPGRQVEVTIKEEPKDDQSPEKALEKIIKNEEEVTIAREAKKTNKKFTLSKPIKTEPEEESSDGRGKRIKKPKVVQDLDTSDHKNSHNKNSVNSVIEEVVKKSQNKPETATKLREDPKRNNCSSSVSINPHQATGSKIIVKRRLLKTKKTSFRCDQCGRVYKYLRGMRQHQKLECNKEPQFPCPFCPSKYRYRQGIREHVRNFHEQAFPRWYTAHYVVPMLVKDHLS